MKRRKTDLFVCRFVDFDKSKNKFCGDERKGERYYCILASTNCKKLALSQQWQCTFTTSLKNRHRKALGKAWAWLHGREQRRLDGISLSPTTRRKFPFREQAQRKI